MHRGDLDDPDGLAKAAADSDGVIHLAFQHEVAFGGDFATAAAADRRAVEAMGAALAGSDRPFVLASGLLALSPGRVATEDDGLVPSDAVRANPAGLRAATGLFTLSLRGVGVRSSVLRFPPTVHGDGDNGFMATFVAIARQRGVAGYVGDGSNRWPAVHRSDAARLARLAVEAAPAGSVLHAVGDEGVPFREIAAAMGRHLDVPTESVAPGDAAEHFAPLGHFVALDSPATARRHPEAARMGADGADLARRSRAGPLLPPGLESRPSEAAPSYHRHPMPGHQEFKALSSEEVERAAVRVAEMEKWAREAYLATKHVEDVEDIWVRYFEAEHHLHWIISPATEPEGS